MTKLLSVRLSVAICILLMASPSAQADIFVSGDTNIIDCLLGIHNGAPLDAGNQQFFKNLLEGASKVVILDSNVPFLQNEGEDARDFYNSLPGVTADLIAGTVTAGHLAGAKLFIAPSPNDGFLLSEVAAIKTLLAEGGNILLTGENADPLFTVSNNAINQLLQDVGSSMSIAPDFTEGGFNQATILPSPFTVGVTTFQLAAGSRVVGGTPLFQTAAGKIFLATEALAIPEPGTMVLLLLCAAACSRRME